MLDMFTSIGAMVAAMFSAFSATDARLRMGVAYAFAPAYDGDRLSRKHGVSIC